MDIATLWQTSVGILKERVSKDAYDTWLTDISIENISDYEAMIRVPNRFFRDWIRDHYQAILEEVIGQVAEKRGLRVAYTISGPETQSKEPLREVLERTPVAVSTRGKRLSHLNPRYVFSTFVAASNNQLVRAACLKVAESPATSYNPLLIYGGVGLGKTHLMHAIGNFVLEQTDLRIA